MSPPVIDAFVDYTSFPRVSGDEPRFFLGLPFSSRFSPRERG